MLLLGALLLVEFIIWVADVDIAYIVERRTRAINF
jgi:hypothetical protein